MAMLEKKSRIFRVKNQKTALLTIPADLVKDSAFPFKVPEEVIVRIDGNRLIVEKAEKNVREAGAN